MASTDVLTSIPTSESIGSTSSLSFHHPQRQPSGSSVASSGGEKSSSLTTSVSTSALQQPSALSSAGSSSSLNIDTNASLIKTTVGDGDAKVDSISSGLTFANNNGMHENLSMMSNNSLFSSTDWHSTPVPASMTAVTAVDDQLGAHGNGDSVKPPEVWGKCKVNQEQPWHANDGEASGEDEVDPMVWKSKPNNGTDLWEKSTGRKVNWMANNDGVGGMRGRGGDQPPGSESMQFRQPDYMMQQRQMSAQQGQSGNGQPVPSWLRDDSTIDMFGGAGSGTSVSSSASVTPTGNMGGGPPPAGPQMNKQSGMAYTSGNYRMASGFADDGTPTPTNHHTPNATPAVSNWSGDQPDGGSNNGWNQQQGGNPQNQAWNQPGNPSAQQSSWNRTMQQQQQPGMPRGDGWSNGNGWQSNLMAQQQPPRNAWGAPVGGMPPPQQQRPNFNNMPPRSMPNNMMNGNSMPQMMNGKPMPSSNAPWAQSMSPNHMQQNAGQQRMPMNAPMNGVRPNNFGPPPIPQQSWGQPNNGMMNKPPGPMSPHRFNGMPNTPASIGPNQSFGLWNAPASAAGESAGGIGSPINSNGSASLGDGPGSANDIWGAQPDNQWSEWSSTNGRTSSGYASDANGTGSANVSGAKSSMAEQHNGQSSSSHSPVNVVSNGTATGGDGDDGTRVWQKKASPPATAAGGNGWSNGNAGDANGWAKDQAVNKQSYNSGNGGMQRSPPVASLPIQTGNGMISANNNNRNSPVETQQTIAHELYSLINEGFLNREEVRLSRNDAEQSRLLHLLINERRNLATFKQHRDQIMHSDPQQADLLRQVMGSQVQSVEQKIDGLMKQYKQAVNKNNPLIQPPHQPQQQQQHAPPPMQQHFNSFHQPPPPQHQQMNSLCNTFNQSMSMSQQPHAHHSGAGAAGFDNGFGGPGGFFSGGGPPSGGGASSFGNGGSGMYNMNNTGGGAGGGSSAFNAEFGSPASVW